MVIYLRINKKYYARKNKMKEIELFRQKYGITQKAIVKECPKIILVKYFQFNIKKNKWEKLFNDEHHTRYSITDFDNIVCNLAYSNFVEEELYNEYLKEVARIKKWKEEHNLNN